MRYYSHAYLGWVYPQKKGKDLLICDNGRWMLI
jgi:hypothetical protein